MVQDIGVFLSDRAPAGAEVIRCTDVDLDRLARALGLYGVSLPQRLAVADQDHGESIGVSNRDTRSRYWQGFIEGGGRLNDLAFAVKLSDYVEAFRRGELSHEAIYAGGGHGCYYHPAYRDLAPFSFVTVTGPNRRLAQGLGYHRAVPFGSMMLSGCYGLLRAAGAL